jgi:hypothetical protein
MLRKIIILGVDIPCTAYCISELCLIYLNTKIARGKVVND